MEDKKKILTTTLVSAVLALMFFSVGVSIANAASLYFSPSSGSYSVGQTITVGVYVNSSDKAMNAASGIVSFPADKLQVVSISKNGSIVNLWVQEPSFSNSAGTVNFEGVVLNPGFTGQAGNIIDINFTAKTAGTGPLSFSSSFVLANDGLGTDILTNSGNASFSVKTSGSASSLQESETTSAGTSGGPSSPEVTSETHPDSNKWYSNPDPVFKWFVPSDVTALQTLAGQYPDSVPTVLYRTLISEKEVKDMSDGIWYFHIRFKNSEGWGETTHFRFQIDAEKPNHFNIKQVKQGDVESPSISFMFDAEDEMSGIDHYIIVIDDKETIIWKDDGTHIYVAQPLDLGNHKMTVQVVDMAGNKLEESIEFVVDALWPPKITEYPSELKRKDILIVEGDAIYSNAEVKIFLQKEEGGDVASYSIKSDESGIFSIKEKIKLKEGRYNLWAVITDKKGVISDSESSEIVVITVTGSDFTLGDFQLINMLILIVLLVIAWYVYNTFILIRKKLKKEISEAQNALHKAFNLLHEEMQEYINLLEKRSRKQILTREEEITLKRFKKNLQDAEKFIEKEIKDIEKELK